MTRDDRIRYDRYHGRTVRRPAVGKVSRFRRADPADWQESRIRREKLITRYLDSVVRDSFTD